MWAEKTLQLDKMRGCVVLLVLCLVQIQAQTVVNRFNGAAGIEADPCIAAQGNGILGGPANCQALPARSAQSSTIMLPSADSVGLVNSHPAIFNSQETITLTGTEIQSNLQFGLSQAGQDCSAGIDTTIAVVNCANAGECDETNLPGSLTITLPTTQGCSSNVPPANVGPRNCWNDVAALSVAQALGAENRLLCFFNPAVGAVTARGWTGLRIGAAWNCESATVNPQSQQRCTLFTPAGPGYENLRVEQTRLLQANTQCCKSNLGFRVGVCVNSAAQQCCGVPYRAWEKCCSSTKQIIQPYNQPCQCTSAGGDADCPANEHCCLPFKYEEFRETSTASGVMAGFVGTCYNNQTHRCCDTGDVYDPGAQQCCSVNGLQSLNIPCPCDVDADCVGGQREYQNSIRDYRCCKQVDPVPLEAPFDQHEVRTDASGRVYSLGKYANFPSGRGLYSAQRCLGSCIDVRYQICCNGVACVKDYERCCNATCCNRFTETCEFGVRPGTPGNQWNYIDLKVKYYQCSSVEAMNPLKAFWIFVLPTALLIATAVAFGIIMVFANKAANRSYSTLERSIITVATFIIILSLLLFFSPAYKYGVVAIFASLIAVLAAAARIRLLNIAALVVVFLAILYVFDPFTGSHIWGFTSFRNLDSGAIHPRTMGLLHTLDLMNRDNQNWCVDYYDYFRLDPQLRDTDRCDNPAEQSFGYCNRWWIMVLLLAAAILMILLLLLFILLVLALFLRFIKPPPSAPIQLEVVPEAEPIVAPPVVAAPPVVVPPPAPIVPMVAPLEPIVAPMGFAPEPYPMPY
eukprot:TRINITY_DN61052_c0_g1_i1.p1 TRINITY_DN61052_c0_g1~~TRINITY_DN61052_c0_g1_i1.p1  ORF type:complete len:800 (-),score=140.88 TRINITY_DN61052_c0_g1_i1:1441-3840(-)